MSDALSVSDKLPRFSRENSTSSDSNAKAMADIDDIFNLVQLLKDKDCLGKLPTYVAMDLGNLPMMKMDEGEFRILKGGLDSLSIDQKEFKAGTISKYIT